MFQRHREKPLYSNYDVIYTLYTLYTSTHYFIESPTGKICHMHYLIWSPPIRIRKEGRAHFQEKQPQVLDFRYATPVLPPCSHHSKHPINRFHHTSPTVAGLCPKVHLLRPGVNKGQAGLHAPVQYCWNTSTL